jgi:hypothetical protein
MNCSGIRRDRDSVVVANRFELPKFDKQPQLNFIDDLQRCLTMSRGTRMSVPVFATPKRLTLEIVAVEAAPNRATELSLFSRYARCWPVIRSDRASIGSHPPLRLT